jgi:RNA polymerase sigma-70 factor (ECF subfamily)
MNEPLLPDLNAAREAFTGLVESGRPELLRYCARMMGSTIEGEDIVQETLVHAFYELSQLRELPALRGWLFRIAHNRATNAIVARARRANDSPLEAVTELPAAALEPDSTFEQAEATGLAIERFLGLAPAQRACVILKDVLGCSLEEVADTIELSLPAVKAALHRGRTRLRELALTPASPRRQHSLEVVRYAALFNANDWEAVRSMLARDVRLELLGRERVSGAEKVGHYFSNYAKIRERHLAPAWMDGREVIAVRSNAGDTRPNYVVELEVAEGSIVVIRDYRYLSYVADEALFD